MFRACLKKRVGKCPKVICTGGFRVLITLSRPSCYDLVAWKRDWERDIFKLHYIFVAVHGVVWGDEAFVCVCKSNRFHSQAREAITHGNLCYVFNLASRVLRQLKNSSFHKRKLYLLKSVCEPATRLATMTSKLQRKWAPLRQRVAIGRPTRTQIDHHVLISEEKHDCDRVVELVHGVEVGNFLAYKTCVGWKGSNGVDPTLAVQCRNVHDNYGNGQHIDSANKKVDKATAKSTRNLSDSQLAPA